MIENVQTTTVALSDIMSKLIFIGAFALIVLVFQVVYVSIKSSQCKSTGISIDLKQYKSFVSMLLAMCITGFMYTIVEILLIVAGPISYEMVYGTSFVYMAIIGLLCAISGLIKGVIAGNSLIRIANDTSQKSLSITMLLMAAAEIPSIISLVLFLLKFFVE
ncbi:MAG: hypothetical protein NC311_07025 [Muribaculaceae bacterium]|nr:hypothetical protein [Muribaculaceae bacterium]MCM1398969.1 hypothetical protein [Clostridium sp.]MCM1458827.1 hypothetical protein [Bacteroides sp.]